MHLSAWYVSPRCEGDVPNSVWARNQRTHKVSWDEKHQQQITNLFINNRYADTALHNSKYTYAILAYHAALTNHHLRNQKESYYSLLNRLGTDICPQNNDNVRALKYLEEMLFKYTTDNKVNEVCCN